jgi:hypothetical protein
MSPTFDETFSQLVSAWTDYHDMVRSGADLDARAQARGRLVRMRSQMAAVRRSLPR